MHKIKAPAITVGAFFRAAHVLAYSLYFTAFCDKIICIHPAVKEGVAIFMYCPNCGKERMRSARRCEHCGYVFDKKPLSRRWWFWVIFVIICIPDILLIAALHYAAPINPENVTAGALQDRPVVEEQQSGNSSQLQTSEGTYPPEYYYHADDAVETELQYKQSCTHVTYQDLARTPDLYIGTRVVLRGEVNQVIEGAFWEPTCLRILVLESDDVNGLDKYDNNLYATVEIPKGGPRILEDDIITIYGEGNGLRSYTTIRGVRLTVPEVAIKYYDFE